MACRLADSACSCGSAGLCFLSFSVFFVFILFFVLITDCSLCRGLTDPSSFLPLRHPDNSSLPWLIVPSNPTPSHPPPRRRSCRSWPRCILAQWFQEGTSGERFKWSVQCLLTSLTATESRHPRPAIRRIIWRCWRSPCINRGHKGGGHI